MARGEKGERGGRDRDRDRDDGEFVEKLVSINSPHPVPFARLLREDPQQRKASDYMALFRLDKAERVLSEVESQQVLAEHSPELALVG